MNSGKELLRYFQNVYIINLPERNDRRIEINNELNKIGLSLDHPNIELFPAVRPKDPGEFPNIGSRGCFLSHLGVLKDALNKNYTRILILEDDLNFEKDFNHSMKEVLNHLSQNDWSFFYGGHHLPSIADIKTPVSIIDSSQGIVTAHFLAIQGNAIPQLIQFLESILSRKAGDPLGGPMHVDGAYSWFRKSKPDLVTFAAFPTLGYQRASKTDIHSLKWYDELFIVRGVVAFARKIKNEIK